MEYRAVIDRASGGKQISNTATASDQNRARRHAGAPDVHLQRAGHAGQAGRRPCGPLGKAADATTVTVGQTLTYRITVRNTGPNDATGVTVTYVLPDGLTFLSAKAPEATTRPP